MESATDDNPVLTGIKPTGRIHLGNYLGMVVPALALAQAHRAFYFIADYHALTTARDPDALHRRIRELAAAWLALGLDPRGTVLFRQSDVPEIFELMWMLACTTSKGLLNRAHAYKALTAENLAAGRDADAGVNAGLYNYPVLMAADILAFRTARVPVGRDQVQHVEMARDMAAAFNRHYGPVLRLPEAMVPARVQTVTGLDGRKMSKSYGNDIPVLAAPDDLRRRVMRIVTDSRPPEAPKDPERCNLFALYRHFAAVADADRLAARYRAGGVAYREVKETLADLLIRRFETARERFAGWMADHGRLDRTLADGAQTARATARRTLADVRQAIGIDGSGRA